MSLEYDERQAIAVLKTKKLTTYEVNAIGNFSKRAEKDPEYKLTAKQRGWLLQLFAAKTQSHSRR